MILVFITRKIDRGDARTGFVFGWIEKFSKNLEKLYVICQEKGDISGLPDNVEIHSFGKEQGIGRLRQLWQFSIFNFQFSKKADGFFCHMMPIYAIISWLPAKLYGKKLALWYTHKSVDLKLRIAEKLVDRIFTASKESFRLKSDKVQIVGHGIDVNKFKTQNSKLKIAIQNSKFKIVSVGRISPVKDYETLIKAAQLLTKKGIKDFTVEIYGSIALAGHKSYLDSLRMFVRNAGLEETVKFQGELSYEYVDEVYREADLVVNLSKTGSIDKAVLEAAASETLVLTSNEAFAEQLGKISSDFLFERDNPLELADKIIKCKSLKIEDRAILAGKLLQWVQRDHNLNNLAEKVTKEFDEKK